MGRVRDLISKYTDRTNKLQFEAERRQFQPAAVPSRSNQTTHVKLVPPYASASARQAASTSPLRVSPLQTKGNRNGLRLARTSNAASITMASPFRLQSIKMHMLPQNTFRRRARDKAYTRRGDRNVTLNVEQLPAPTPWAESVLQRSQAHSTTRGKLVQLHPSTVSNTRGPAPGRVQNVQHVQPTRVTDARKLNERPRQKRNHTLQRLKALRPLSVKSTQRHISKVNRNPNSGPVFVFASRNLPRSIMARSRTPTNQSEGSAKYSTFGRKAMTTRSHTSTSGARSRFRRGEAVAGVVRRTASEGLTRSFKMGSEAAHHAISLDLSRGIPRSMHRHRPHASTEDMIIESMVKESSLRETLEAFLVEKDPELYGEGSSKSLHDVRRHVEYLYKTYDFSDLANAVRVKYATLPRTWDMELVRLGESDIDVLL